jgi:hypothetical protein
MAAQDEAVRMFGPSDEAEDLHVCAGWLTGTERLDRRYRRSGISRYLKRYRCYKPADSRQFTELATMVPWCLRREKTSEFYTKSKVPSEEELALPQVLKV